MQAIKTDGIKPRSSGFSLIEVMIVVAVIGILVSVALPGYENYMRRMKLADSVAALADYRVALEQYYQDNRNYGAAAGGACTLTGSATSTVNKYFTYACVVGATVNEYTVTATSRAAAGLGAAGDYVYTLNEQNVRATTKFKGVASSTTPCWKVSGSEC
jgi:type IV pilus assembly protein PilE